MPNPIRTKTHSIPAAETRNRWTLALAFALSVLSVLSGLALAQSGDAEADEAALVVEVEDRSVTRAEFDERFDIAVRAAAMQQGVPVTEETLAQFADQRGAFLKELAMQLALLHEAEERGIVATDRDVEAAVTSFRDQFESEAEFTTRVEDLGFEDANALHASVKESLTIQALVNDISTDATPTDDQVRAFFDDNPEQFETPDGEVEFEDVRAEIQQYLVQQEVNERIQEIRADTKIEMHPDNL